MVTKAELLRTILVEFRKAQIEDWKPPEAGKVRELRLPPSLPMGDGMQLRATESLLDAVSDYSDLLWENDPTLMAGFSKVELEKVTRRAFGRAFSNADLERTDEELQQEIKSDVAIQLSSDIEFARQLLALTVGCHLFDGDAAYPIRVGPVLFETRQQWMSRALDEGKISETTARRLKSIWSKKPVRKRKPSSESMVERTMVDVVGDCPVVCTVETFGLSQDFVRTKGLLAARLAMTAIALMWTHPSEGLSWMGLLYDRRSYQRRTMAFKS